MQFSSADQTHDVYLFQAWLCGDDVAYVDLCIVRRSVYSSLVVALGMLERCFRLLGREGSYA
jgi:hypothetical protein